MKIPIAAAITLAFQARINIAPAPKKSANNKQKNKTFKLLDKIVKKLIGNDFLNQVYVLNRENYRLTKNRWTNLDNLLAGLAPLLYSPQTRTGIIVNSENSLKTKYLYYTIVAPNKKTAYEYQEKMTALLANGQTTTNSTPASY